MRREIAWIFSNALNNANQEQLEILFEKNLMGFFGKIIEDDWDFKMQEIEVRGIWKILNLPRFSRDYCLSLMKQNGIIEKIEKLKYHPNPQINELVMKILEYANVEEENW